LTELREIDRESRGKTEEPSNKIEKNRKNGKKQRKHSNNELE